MKLNEETCYDSDEETDKDVCDKSEIARVFRKCSGLSNNVVASNKNYIMNINSTFNNSDRNIAVSYTNNVWEIFTLNESEFTKTFTFQEDCANVIDVKFSGVNNNLLYVGCNNSNISLHDLRTPEKSPISFTDSTKNGTSLEKTTNCFDVASNDRLLCAGTDVHEGDAYILFWDIRNTKLLGAYWESHTDDITQVKFNNSDFNKLASGSTDGLINIYDLTKPLEDDALVDSLNTESSIEQLQWHRKRNQDLLSCVTHTAEIQIWKMEDVQPSITFTRADLATGLKRTSENHVYVVNTHSLNDSVFILAGSNANDGECVRGVEVVDNKLKPYCGLFENKQRIRCSWFDEKKNLLLTGGEMGILNAWILIDDFQNGG